MEEGLAEHEMGVMKRKSDRCGVCSKRAQAWLKFESKNKANY